MATQMLIRKSTTSARVNNVVDKIRDPLVDELMTIVLAQRKSVTVWEAAARLRDGRTERASAILDGLFTQGVLARFRAGFNNYYSPPEVALIEKEPTFRTVVSDSLKSLFFSYQHKVVGYFK